MESIISLKEILKRVCSIALGHSEPTHNRVTIVLLHVGIHPSTYPVVVVKVRPVAEVLIPEGVVVSKVVAVRSVLHEVVPVIVISEYAHFLDS